MNVFELAAKINLNTKDYEDGLKKASSKTSSFGSKLKSGLSGAMKVGTAVIGATTAAVGALGGALIAGAKQTASYADNIDKMSQKMGMSAQGFQEWDFIMQHCGTSMETMKASMKTLATAAETGNDAFTQLGITQEDLKRLNQEELFNKTISALQNVEDETQRTYLAGQLMGRGATELGAVLNMTAEETEAMKQQLADLGGLMENDAVKAGATFQDSLQNLQTAFSGVKNNLMAEFLPSLSTAMDGLSMIFSGQDGGLEKLVEGINGFVGKIREALPKIMEVGMQIISSLGIAIIENLPTLIASGMSIITMLIQGISDNLPLILHSAIEIVMLLVNSLIENLPLLLNVALQIIISLAQGISENLPTLIPAIVDIVLQLVEILTSPDTLMQLIMVAIELIMALADGLIEALPLLIEKAPIIIGNLLTAIAEKLPEVLAKGVELVVKLASGVVQAIPQLCQAAFDIMLKFIESIVKYFANLRQKGSEIVAKVGEGIRGAINSAITWGKDLIQNFINGVLAKWNALKTTVSNVAQSVKDFLGFSEPKKGPLSNFHTYAPDMIDLFVKGINDNKNRLEDTLKSALSFDMGVMSGTVAYAGNGYGANGTIGNITNNFYGQYSERDSAKFIRSINRRLGAEMR